MTNSFDISEFCERGYTKFKVLDTHALTLLRLEIIEHFRNTLFKFGLDGNTLVALDDLHKLLCTGDINQFRLSCIDTLNALESINTRLLVDPLPDFIFSLFGPDQLIQKHVNLTIQRPFDPDNSELHRDYPGNSKFELVVWIPMVDCTVDMSMYILDFDRSIEIARDLARSSEVNWSHLKETVDKFANYVPVQFGEVLVFMTPVFHGSRINIMNRTRVSFNFRLKGLYYPCGMRDPYAFWSILKISKFTRKLLRDLHE